MARSSAMTKREQIRQLAENDLEVFIRLVHPGRVLGSIHKEVIQWWTRQDAKSHQLLLLPRDHQKSALVAYRVAWWITRNPSIRILYISATSGLAIKQLKFIKDILTSDIYRYYWPDMVNQEETKREKWTETEISVDHPLRRAEAVRDPTIFTAGLTTNIVGMHSDISVFDDVVVPDNAYTEETRGKVQAQYSQLASIEGADSSQWVVGTRYHPKDLYADMISMSVETFNESGDLTGSEPLYEVFQREVENVGDGSGEFLWPRQQRYDGKWFGFNTEVLARKRAQYLDRAQYYAQYYNNPNAIDDSPIDPDLFQYYEPTFLKQRDGYWHYKDRRLNVFAAIDFAFTLGKRSDYTCIVTVGVDFDHNYYVMDIDRFRTDRISDYFDHLLRAHEKYGFRRLRAEVTAAQSVLVKDLKENYIRPYGLSLSIEEFKPNRNQGNKEERVAAVLHPRYENQQIWHYKGGNVQLLEEELLSRNPQHDDIKDTLASAIETSVAPTGAARRPQTNVIQLFNERFGGIA
jgi:hypothetical protein